MSSMIKLSLAVALALASVSAGWAAPKTLYKTVKRNAALPTSSAPASRTTDTPRGAGASSYDCVTDEGYGRTRSCDSF